MSRLHTQRRNRVGFTLIEAIAAIVVVSVAIPPLLWALGESRRSAISPAMHTQARWLASEKLSDVLADRCSAVRGYPYLTASNYPPESPVRGFAGFSRSVTFTPCGPDLRPGGAGCTLAEVTVGWTDARATPRTFSLRALAAEDLP